MFANCCQAFEEFYKIQGFQRFQDCYQTTEGNIDDLIGQFQTQIKKWHRDKERVMAHCRTKMTQAERNSEQESISKIEDYKKFEKRKFREIEREQTRLQDTGRSVDYTFYEDSLANKIKALKGELMDIEIKLKQALDQARA